ncbi:MAG: response regulator [Anaerolineae bacterium]
MEEIDPSLSGPSADQPSAEFVRSVRDLLVHLYDPAHLLRQPLAKLLVQVLPERGDVAQRLRDFVLDALESLEPPERLGRTVEREQRPYLVLFHRYADGFTTEETIEALHISPRQFQREHQKGLQALAAHIWGYCRERMGAARLSAAGASPSLRAAVDTFGVQLEAAPLGELLSSADAAILALTRRCDVDYDAGPHAGQWRCLYDRVLAKQALLSCFSSLCARRPARLCVAISGHQRGSSLDIGIVPPIPAGDVDDLDQALSTCRTLLVSQGAGLQWLRTGAGQAEGIRLSFRPETSGHVLVVDDNEEMLDLYRRYLAAGKYAVSAAASAAEAEAAIECSTPDAIVLDVMMREVDGWELLQRLRARPGLRSVPVIVCSILNEPELAYALGAQAYLKKPIISDDLLATLDRVLEGSSREGQLPATP